MKQSLQAWSRSRHDCKTQLGTWGALWCYFLIAVRLIWDEKKYNSPCLPVVYVVIWVKTIFLCFIVFTCNFKSCNRDLFNKISCLLFFRAQKRSVCIRAWRLVEVVFFQNRDVMNFLLSNTWKVFSTYQKGLLISFPNT